MIVAPFVLALVVAQAGLPAQPNASAVRPGAIHGRVSRPDGRPAARADVRLMPIERARPGRVAVTDPDGAYTFDDVPPGFYRVVAQKSGYIFTEYGNRSLDRSGEVIAVDPGELRDRIDITLVRHSAITGRVTDENGDPVEGARVHAQRLRYVDGRYRLVDAFGARGRVTDDRGRFRVYGLEAGSYFVSAVVGQLDYPANAMVNLPGYAPTFYPGRARASDAQPIEVPAGQDVAIPDFALVPVRTARVSGTALNSRGEPITGGLVIRPTVRSGGVGEEFGARIERAMAHSSFATSHQVNTSSWRPRGAGGYRSKRSLPRRS